MSIQSLKELKAENAEAAETTEVADEEVAIDEVEEVEAVEEVAEQAETEILEGEEEASESETEAEAWMQSDEQASHDNGVPVSKHVGMKHKLKGQIQERDSEIEQLRAEIEALKTGKTVQEPQAQEPPKKPVLADFNYDNEKYAEALADYSDKLVDYKLGVANQKSQQTQTVEAQKQKLDASVDSHYQRAAQLIEGTTITADKYREADTAVRASVEQLVEGQGDVIVDTMIAKLGEGSEKVMYRLGVNQADRLKLQQCLREDPGGLSAMLFLGELKTKLTTASAKRVTNAPKPGTQVSGDGGSSSAKAALRKYKDAHKKGDASTAFKVKREAKKAGVDTSTW